MRRKKIQLAFDVEFDPAEYLGAEREREVKDTAKRREVLLFMRRMARHCALRHPRRWCTADAVFQRICRYGHQASALGRVAGGVFRGREWQPTAYRVRSRRASNHGREIKIWRWVGERGFSPGADPLSPHAVLLDGSEAADGYGLPGTCERCGGPLSESADLPQNGCRNGECR